MPSSYSSRQITNGIFHTVNHISKSTKYSTYSPNFVNYLNNSNRFNICTITKHYKHDVNYFNNHKQTFLSNVHNYRIRFFSTIPEQSQDFVDTRDINQESQDNLLNAAKAYSTKSKDHISELVEELGIESEISKEKLTVEELYQIPDYHEYLLARINDFIGTNRSFLQEYLPVNYLQQLFIAVHDCTNLSWAATISLMTIFFKLVSLPIWSNTERIRRMNAHLIPRVSELQETAKHAFRTRNEKLARETQRQIYEITKKRSFIKGSFIQFGSTAFQGLMFGTVYGGLKLFAMNPTYRPDFTFESCLWLDSLCLPDPYYILPSLFGILLHIVFEYNLSLNLSTTASAKVSEKVKNKQKIMKIASRIGIIVFTVYGFTMPSVAFFYLIPSFLFQTILRYSCNRFEVARFFGIPVLNMKKGKEPKL